MTKNKDLFKELSNSCTLKVRVEDGKYITVNGKWIVAISTDRGTKLISNVLYVLEIDQNLFSVGQLVKKGYTSRTKAVWLKTLVTKIFSK